MKSKLTEMERNTLLHLAEKAHITWFTISEDDTIICNQQDNLPFSLQIGIQSLDAELDDLSKYTPTVEETATYLQLLLDLCIPSKRLYKDPWIAGKQPALSSASIPLVEFQTLLFCMGIQAKVSVKDHQLTWTPITPNTVEITTEVVTDALSDYFGIHATNLRPFGWTPNLKIIFDYTDSNKRYLVYEKNYLNDSDVDCVEEGDFKLYKSKTQAMRDLIARKEMYIQDTDNEFTFMENESSETCFVFADELASNQTNREGEFHICMTILEER